MQMKEQLKVREPVILEEMEEIDGDWEGEGLPRELICLETIVLR